MAMAMTMAGAYSLSEADIQMPCPMPRRSGALLAQQFNAVLSPDLECAGATG